MATHAGGGYSRWRDLAVTRWREDATCDNHGTFIYLRDRDHGRNWSTAHQPTGRKADRYEAVFVQGRAEYRRVDHAIETHTEVSVSPEDDVEIRRVTLTNQSDDMPRDRSDQLCGSGHGAPKQPTSAIAPSATCSCRPRSCPTMGRYSANGGLAHQKKRRPGCSICWRPQVP